MDDRIDSLLQREEIRLASIRSRMAAFGVDEILLTIVVTIILWDSIVQAQSYEQIIDLTNNFILEYMSIKIVYQTFFVMQYGATLGKIAMKIRIIERDHVGNPGVLSAFNRAVFRVVSELLFYLGFIWGMMDPYRRTWHDRSAKTLVIDA